jgi:peptidylprolyl isomerase
MVYKIDKSDLPEGTVCQTGSKIRIHVPEGLEMDAVIIEVNENSVKIDANHPLAGQYVIYEMKLLEII